MTRHAILLLAVAACGSSPDARPVASTDQLDACAYVPAEIADLVLDGAAHDPSLTSTSTEAGACVWRGADPLDRLVVSVMRTGTGADRFAQDCAAGDWPLPAIDNRGVGLAACGQAEVSGASLMIQLDATTTTLALYGNVGTLDDAFEVLGEVAARVSAR